LNLKNIHNIYFIGIGGIGMSALALYFNKLGKNVAGYDKISTEITENLENCGILIHFDDVVELIPNGFKNIDNTLVVYTPAIPKNHLEYNYFMEQHFTILKRSEVLGKITKNSFCLAVAGTHGKTTTSTILGHIFKEANTNATSFLGGISENYNSNLILGGEEVTIVEADEYDRSFLQLAPNIACITSMDADHLDIYGEASELKSSFIEFSNKVSQTIIVKKGLPIQGLTYGIEENADFDAQHIRIENGFYVFDVKTPNGLIKNIKSNLPGKYNVLNTVAALAMANCYGISLQVIAKALLSFKGIKRRFSYKINTENLVLIDDYAHHPTEINAAAKAIKELYPTKKILGVFQPHLFSRTKDFANEFAISLSLFNELILLDIYPARERPIEGVNSNWLLNKINIEKKQVSSKENLIKNILKSQAEVIAILGAGDIGEMVEPIKKSLEVEN